MALQKFRLFLCAAGAWIYALTGLAPLPPAWAQSITTLSGNAAEVPHPADILKSALSGKKGMPALDRYLRGDGVSPVIVARRAAALIRALGKERDNLRPQDLLSAVDTITHVAARSLSYAAVMRLAIADDYQPKGAILAWDFGPHGGTVMAGFEHVAPKDSRLSGSGIAALRGTAENALLGDGIAGLRKIKLDLPDGDYRIILMTQNFGVPNLVRNPFGEEIRINSVPLIVMRHGPPTWLSYALLTGSHTPQAHNHLRRVRGYLSGDVRQDIHGLLNRQQGGAIVVEGTARRGKISIEMTGFDQTQSYLTGLIVERLDEPSSLLLSDRALQSVMPNELRLALETEILLVAAEIVQGIAPAAGQALPSSDVVTPN